MSNNSKIKIPLGMRFIAWWEGYDVADLEARLRRRQLAKKAGRLSEILKGSLGEPKKTPWRKIRIQLTQLVWGEGYCGPGGSRNIIEMTKLLHLKPEKSIMIIGAGLGGPARTLVSEYGVWVEGYESSAELAREGMEMSTNLGLAKKAQIVHRDLNDISSFERNYDCVFSKETIFAVENKTQLLQAIYESLKPDGLFLFTDLVLRDTGCLENPEVQKWIQQEGGAPCPVAIKDFVGILEQCGFIIRVNEDITKHYLGLVAQAWGNAEQLVRSLMARGEDARDSLETVAKEAKFWEQRKKVMTSGDLRVMRYLVQKKGEIV